MAAFPTPPSASRFNRRQFAIGAGAALVFGSSDRVRAAVLRDQPSLDEDIVTRFMTLSRFITGHDHLSVGTGENLLDGLTRLDPHFPDAIDLMQTRIREGGLADVTALDAALKNASDPLHGTMLRLIRGWYAGVIEEGSHAPVYACESALMYQPSRDNIPVPTYAHNGPNYWVAEPRPVDAMPIF